LTGKSRGAGCAGRGRSLPRPLQRRGDKRGAAEERTAERNEKVVGSTSTGDLKFTC